MTTVSVVRRLWDRLAGLSLPAKLVFGAIATAAAGPGVLYLLVELATYFYSVRANFRPPFEGVVYLQKAVILFSLFVSITLASILVTIRWLLAQGADWFLRMVVAIYVPVRTALSQRDAPADFDRDAEDFANRLVRAPPTFISFILLCIVGAILFGVAAPNLDDSPESMRFFTITSDIGMRAGLFLFVMGILFGHRRNFLVAAFGIVFYLTAIATLFLPGTYESFLRFTRYGGDIAVLVKTSEGTEQCDLLLRTNEALICRGGGGFPVDSSVASWEIPMREVQRMSYDAADPIELSPEN